jgi:DNA-binding protein H-NS
MEKQASDLKQKHDDIARLKEENKRLNARLSQKSTPPDAAKSAISTKPTSTLEMAALQKINKDHIEKLNNQKFQINSLLAQNASLKERLKSAGASAGGDNGERHDDHRKDAESRDHGERETWETRGRTPSPRPEPSRRDSSASSILATQVNEQHHRVASDISRRCSDYSSFASYGKRNSTTFDSRSHWERSVRSTPIPKEAPYVPTGPRAPQVRLQPTYMP